ncbi:MAG: FAD-binding oxidoreductase [Chloroflexi bacterium]|nr:FAD-binding oxidoreductase [Chloroflexota bacterium]
MSRQYDAIIIGSGIIGCAVSFEMAKRGYKTLNIDKLPAAGYGSTSNSCAIIRAHYSTWDGVAMAYENALYWDDWANYIGVEDERGLAKFIQCGCLILNRTETDYKRWTDLFDQIGVPYEMWTLEQTLEKYPFMDPHTFYPPKALDDETFWDEPSEMLTGAIITPTMGYISDPQLSTHNLMRAAEAHGGTFMFNQEVVAVRRDNDHFDLAQHRRVTGITLKNGQKINAPIVVNVAGPHSFIINRLAGVEEGMNIKTKPLRHEVHHVPSPPSFDYEKEGTELSDPAGIYCRPEVGRSILVGSEDPECDPREWVDDPDNFNRELTDIQWKRQVYRLARRIPELQIPSQPRGVVDLYDVADDWIPIYDKSDLPGFYMAVGTSGNQFKNAGGVGHMMAELITACENGHDHDVDPIQVKMPYTGLVLNAGFYSRLREINKDSSFSVLG